MRKGVFSYGDSAVLYRTNAQSRLLEERFVRENIPYKIVGGVNFYARKEIKDLLCYLKTIDNAQDDLAVKRIINVPKRGIGATTIAKVQDYADENGMKFLCRAETGGRDIDAEQSYCDQDSSFCDFYSDAAQQAALYQCGTTHG